MKNIGESRVRTRVKAKDFFASNTWCSDFSSIVSTSRNRTELNNMEDEGVFNILELMISGIWLKRIGWLWILRIPQGTNAGWAPVTLSAIFV